MICEQRENLSRLLLTAMGQGDKKKASAMKHLLDTHLRDCPNCNPQTVTEPAWSVGVWKNGSKWVVREAR